jgi:putative oxygen-independent coproporphyrinogen III oxidase
LNAYLHIPFCTSICSYCDFTSFAGREGRKAAYSAALCREIGASSLKGPLETVYFGGGTPSLLAPEELERILDSLRDRAGFAPEAEVSLEANPETVDGNRLRSYRRAGVNRLSLGAQAVQKDILRSLGRGHGWDRVEGAVGEARAAGFQNLNLDLMFGLPGQSPGHFRESLEKAVQLGPEHLSLYALQVEEGTPLARQVAGGLPLPPEDRTADEYAWAQAFLAEAGYIQYEVSNFSRPGKTCRHNWNIWRGKDYWGFGVAAVGTVGGVRHSHGEDLAEYIREAGRGSGLLHLEPLGEEIRAWERIMLGLRTDLGVSREELEGYGAARGLPYGEKLGLLLREGFLLSDGNRYRVAPKGYFVLNGILNHLAA